MTENKQKSDRQYAANMARKYFSGQISKNQVLDSFPNYENDIKLRLLHKRIIEKPKKVFLFGVSNKKYKKFIFETYEIIEDLETDKLRFKTMKILLKQLWLQSNEFTEPIKNMGFQIFEVSKMTYNTNLEVTRYLNLLVEKNYIKKVSDDPLLYEFTESGMKIKTDSEIEKVIENVA
ncbi:hypothetical protein [Psychroserpens ponticola]|uniref:MarR family transcriptional regulator n=1 Tax=Psychroserpens ponticola TaxID=2932268 RepID=A0ABY7S2D4_9FLAO|nr:hypothetical protein [Psychroserpens ponticola]WCO03548.1 hypothetical protein MUN68_008575 [Psychroserpens ponticola]